MPLVFYFLMFALVLIVDLIDVLIYLSILAVAQWIVHMPPKRGIQVRFLSAGPFTSQ